MIEIELGSFIWTVELKDGHDPIMIVDSNYCQGVTNYGPEQHIYIEKTLSAQLMEKVIRHEFTHAILWSTQLSRSNKLGIEEVCDLIGLYGEEIVHKAHLITKELIKGRV